MHLYAAYQENGWREWLSDLLDSETEHLPPEDILVQVLKRAGQLFAGDRFVLNLPADIFIIGDIHGQYLHLVQLFQQLDISPDRPEPEAQMLFLGDLVDRGNQSLEVVFLVFLMKIFWPEKIFLLRGNHETREVNREGLRKEILTKGYTDFLWEAINDVFDYLPICAVIGRRIFCVHGGLSPDVRSPDDIQDIRPCNPATIPVLTQTGMVTVARDPAAQFMIDMMWSDPANLPHQYCRSIRGCGWMFNEEATAQFMARSGFECIVRGHQAVDGYDFPFGPDNRTLITIHSAPGIYGEDPLRGAAMHVAWDLGCRLLEMACSLPEEEEYVVEIT